MPNSDRETMYSNKICDPSSENIKLKIIMIKFKVIKYDDKIKICQCQLFWI